MDGLLCVLLDRWLVTSNTAFQALIKHWRTEAGPGSLLDWRLRNGLMEAISPDQILERIGILAEKGNASFSLVVAGTDASLLKGLEDLADRVVIRLFDWNQSSLVVALASNGPDQFLLAKLEGHSGFDRHYVGTIPERAIYKAALAHWENECRHGDSASFAERYPQAGPAIAWDILAGSITSLPVANDNDWISIRSLAASTSYDPETGFVFGDPEHEPALWDITLAPIDGGPRSLLRFRASGPSSSDFVGKHVWVRAAGRLIDLGKVDEMGRASVVLDDLLELSDMSIAVVGG